MTKNEKGYCLPEEYRARDVTLSKDSVSGRRYWDSKRLKVSYHYQFPVYRFAVELVKRNALQSVLDVGCGVAPKLEYLKKEAPWIRITGIDQDHPIRYCRDTYPFGTWLTDDLENPDIDVWPTADLVICADVVEHLGDPDPLVKNLRSVCIAGGTLLISTPDRDRLYGPGRLTSGHDHHVREWNQEEFRKFLESRGWEVLDQFLTSPVKIAPTLTFLREVWKQREWERRFRYNQVCVATVADE